MTGALLVMVVVGLAVAQADRVWATDESADAAMAPIESDRVTAGLDHPATGALYLSATTAPPPVTAPPTTQPPTTTSPPTIPPPVTPPPTEPITTVPPAATAPAPAPPPATAPETPESPEERVHRAFVTGVPAAWRQAIAIELEVIEGSTSWAVGGGRIMIAESHAAARFEHLVDVVAHEFGHQVAFEFGSGAYAGAGPEGWQSSSANPAETWADCVQTVFTGRSSPSHGLSPCAGEPLEWARFWLATPPAT